jgi:hypothetical protein
VRRRGQRQRIALHGHRPPQERLRRT